MSCTITTAWVKDVAYERTEHSPRRGLRRSLGKERAKTLSDFSSSKVDAVAGSIVGSTQHEDKPPQTPQSNKDPSTTSSPPLPTQIGRYRVEWVLGQGGFGRVYLAYDAQLERRVAIKVPHMQRVANASDARAYLTEARMVASLDHPNIVPMYDVGQSEEFPCYLVSKYIEGTTLAARLSESRPSSDEVPNWLLRWPKRCTMRTRAIWCIAM